MVISKDEIILPEVDYEKFAHLDPITVGEILCQTKPLVDEYARRVVLLNIEKHGLVKRDAGKTDMSTTACDDQFAPAEQPH